MKAFSCYLGDEVGHQLLDVVDFLVHLPHLNRHISLIVMDGSGFGLGTRSQRYAMIIDDGVVSVLNVESGPGLDVSSAETILEQL